MKNKILKNARNVIIGFFVLVFVMGFFSKSIINLFLPKVMVEKAVEGTVQRTLAIEGLVEAQKTYKVRLPDAVIIEEYLVRNGDTVQVGSPLFRINTTLGLERMDSAVERLKLQQESNSLRIAELKGTTYQIELKNIAALENRLKEAELELAKQQALFDAGVIALQELEGYKKSIGQLQMDIDLMKLQLEDRKRQTAAEIKSVENQQKSIELQIKDAKSQQATKTYVDSEGIYYSEISGVVTKLDEGQDMIQGNGVLLEIAETKEGQPLVFAADISGRDYEFVKSAGGMQIDGKTIMDSKFIEISSIYKQGNGDSYRVEGFIKKEEQGDLVLGDKLRGSVKQKYAVKGGYKIPKASVIVFDEFKVGSEGNVCLLEAVEGVLGTELKVKEMPVKLLAVGDNDVIVSGLETIEDPQVIVNLSYKISDGKKVFLWQ